MYIYYHIIDLGIILKVSLTVATVCVVMNTCPNKWLESSEYQYKVKIKIKIKKTTTIVVLYSIATSKEINGEL